MSPEKHPYPIGTKVRVDGFPPSVAQALPFNYNGLVGEVRFAERVGFGIDNQPVYQYQVHFDDVDIPYCQLNPETNKLNRGIQKGSAENFFEQEYLQLV